MPQHDPLGTALSQAMQQGRFAQALQQANRQLKKPGPHPYALWQLAAQAAEKLHDIPQAERLWRMAITAPDQQGQALVGLGELLEEAQRLPEAHTAFRTALGFNPHLGSAHHGLGRLLEGAGELQAALQCYQQAVTLEGGLNSARFRLGRLWQRLGEPQQAKQAFAEILSQHPHFYLARLHLAECQQRLGEAQQAEQNYLLVIQQQASLPEAHNQLANLYTDQRHFAQAIHHYQAAIELRPSVAMFHYNLGYVYLLQNDHATAAQHYSNAYRLDPQLGGALGSMILCDMMLCRWDRLEAHIAGVKALLGGERAQHAPPLVPFITTYLPQIGAALQRQAGAQFTQLSFGAIMAQPPLAAAHRPRATGSPLRIGYLSADFRNHAISRLAIGVLEGHDRRQFTLTAFAIGPDTDDAMRQRVKQAVHHFHLIGHLDDAAAARFIAAQEIDILVDMMGYTTHARPGILAHRPAPVQVSWLGYPGGMGDRRLADYLVGDPINTPAHEAHLHAEWLAIMPHCYQPNPRTLACDPTPSRQEAGLPPQGVVFGSFNQSYKITPQIVALWSRLLHAVEHGVLWLLDPDLPAAVEHLQAHFAAHGIAKQRVIFAPRLSMAAHMGRLPLVDVALDTFPYTSHTTASDALWSGVPLVAWRGETFASRVSTCLAINMGMQELVVEDGEHYLALAQALAHDPQRRAALRDRLRQTREHAPLYDAPLFTTHLEHLYQQMWRNHSHGQHRLIDGSGATLDQPIARP
ncbi:tetratricopeptide repeat protein [Magnetococcus marinus]|nr:tetratricopeptide repeat protein [Magnetococcus marinus]